MKIDIVSGKLLIVIGKLIVVIQYLFLSYYKISTLKNLRVLCVDLRVLSGKKIINH